MIKVYVFENIQLRDFNLINIDIVNISVIILLKNKVDVKIYLKYNSIKHAITYLKH